MTTYRLGISIKYIITVCPSSIPGMAVQVGRLIQVDNSSPVDVGQLAAVHVAALWAGTVPLAAPVALENGVALQLVAVQTAVLHLRMKTNEYRHMKPQGDRGRKSAENIHIVSLGLFKAQYEQELRLGSFLGVFLAIYIDRQNTSN